jgi:hypothetical protein
MRLGLKMLNSSSTLNSLSYLNQIQINPGDTAVVMFQLVDMDQNSLRYIPSSPFSITAKISSSNDDNILNKIPTQPFSQDSSIFQFALNTTETKQLGSVNLNITLSEGASVKSALANSVIVASPKNPYQC